MSSQSPLPVSILSSPASQLNITFQHFILKDITSTLILITIFISIALFILLNLSHSNNLMPINPLSTPSHLVPEWYFLYLYSILKDLGITFNGHYVADENSQNIYFTVIRHPVDRFQSLLNY